MELVPDVQIELGLLAPNGGEGMLAVLSLTTKSPAAQR
jgi:hypothetical protein